MFCKDHFQCCGRNDLSWGKRGSRETRWKSDRLGQMGEADDLAAVVGLENRHADRVGVFGSRTERTC